MNKRRVPRVTLINTILFKGIVTEFWAKAQSVCEGQSDASHSDCLSRFGLITPDRGNIRGRISPGGSGSTEGCGLKNKGNIYLFHFKNPH